MEIIIDQGKPVSIYAQLAEQLRAKILSGELPPGTRLPSELELAKHHQISRGTTRQAMLILANEGLIARVQGKGTYVSARSAATAKMLIGAILPYKHDRLTLDILIGIENAVKQKDYLVIFSQTEEDPEIEALNVRRLRNEGASGLIIFPSSNTEHDNTIAQLHAEDFPFVLVDRYLPGTATNYVVAANLEGGYQATSHLLDLGHRRIGFLTPGALSTTSVGDRFRGYRQALAERGIPYDETLFFHYENVMQPDPELESLRAYLTAPDRPSAVFAVTDLLAIRVLDAAQREGIRVPDDLALVGFDDIDQAAQVSVPLTTIAQPRVEIGARAGEILLACIGGSNAKPVQTVLPVSLVVRQSCGANG